MVKKSVGIANLCLGAALLFGCASTSTNSNEFLQEAAQGGMSEVQLGQMAATRGTSELVKQFGQRMVDDHTKANQELIRLAVQKNVTLPQAVNSKQQSIADKLTKLTGADFDKEYIADMVDDHEEDVEAFSKQAEKGTDAAVKAFAAQTLPTLQKHLQLAREIKAK